MNAWRRAFHSKCAPTEAILHQQRLESIATKAQKQVDSDSWPLRRRKRKGIRRTLSTPRILRQTKIRVNSRAKTLLHTLFPDKVVNQLYLNYLVEHNNGQATRVTTMMAKIRIGK